MRKKYLIHGEKSACGGCKDRPVCQECGTGQLCDNDTADHFCGWHECPTYDKTRMVAYRTRMNEYIRSK
jgi:hypothetical protein